MFAFAGASTFPTIQADMKDKTQFPKAAVLAMMGNLARHCESSKWVPSPLPDLHAHDGGQLGTTRRLGPVQRHGCTVRRPGKSYTRL